MSSITFFLAIQKHCWNSRAGRDTHFTKRGNQGFSPPGFGHCWRELPQSHGLKVSRAKAAHVPWLHLLTGLGGITNMNHTSSSPRLHQFPSCRFHVSHTPKSPSPELQTHASSWFRKISICKSHRQLRLKMFRTKHCHRSNTCSEVHRSITTEKSQAWILENNGHLPLPRLYIQLAAVKSLSLELSFLSRFPLFSYTRGLRQPPVACCFLMTMPMSKLPSIRFPHQWRGHLAKTQGWPIFPLPKTPRSHHLAQWFSQGMVVPPGVRFRNLGVELLVATMIGRSLLWVKAKSTWHL